MAEDISQLIQALELHQPFVVGYSDGGQPGLHMAITYPGLAREETASPDQDWLNVAALAEVKDAVARDCARRQQLLDEQYQQLRSRYQVHIAGQ